MLPLQRAVKSPTSSARLLPYFILYVRLFIRYTWIICWLYILEVSSSNYSSSDHNTKLVTGDLITDTCPSDL